ncbi:MAG: lipid II flippase MurJ [Candidatus Levybacteria bacterium]|nr:lipid II flippase MurJ [Candidatus Levybacteria bacterium]
MPKDFLKKGISLLLRQQTNILSAAFIIMSTVILSQILGLIKKRLLINIFGPTNILGIYDFSSLFPETIFQITIAAALASAFIPVFSDYLAKGKNEEAHKMASSLLLISLFVLSIFSLIVAIFAPFFLRIFNLGSHFSTEQMSLMSNLMRIFMISQLLFTIGTFFSALLQSYNRFFIPGIAAALYNVGMIVGILSLSSSLGIYAGPIGAVFGALIFVLAQLPFTKKVGFSFKPSFTVILTDGIKKIFKLMWPRTISIVIFQLGTLGVASFISYLPEPGRMNILYDSAKTLSVAPVLLFGQSIAQAAFPVLSRQKDNLENFKTTFITSFNQMLYLILPMSIIILVLRIPIVRLIWGASTFDWQATVLTGRILAVFALSIFAQSLITLILRGFYALHDTFTPLIIGGVSTLIMIITVYLFVVVYHLGIESIALAYSITSILQILIFLIFLDKAVGGFKKIPILISLVKFFFATLFTGFALYVPIKLLDQLVFDTTRTINLLLLTGISSFTGLSLYIFLTWFFNVKEATTFLLLFKKIGNWREILGKSDEVIDGTRIKP